MLQIYPHHISDTDRGTIHQRSYEGVEGACDSVPSKWISAGLEPKPLAALRAKHTRFPVDVGY